MIPGVASCGIAVWALFRQKQFALLILLQGIIIVGWIVIQLMMVVSFHLLHLVIGAVGTVLMVIGYCIHKQKMLAPAV